VVLHECQAEDIPRKREGDHVNNDDEVARRCVAKVRGGARFCYGDVPLRRQILHRVRQEGIVRFRVRVGVLLGYELV
jgi:hypothetical protein